VALVPNADLIPTNAAPWPWVLQIADNRPPSKPFAIATTIQGALVFDIGLAPQHGKPGAFRFSWYWHWQNNALADTRY